VGSCTSVRITQSFCLHLRGSTSPIAHHVTSCRHETDSFSSLVYLTTLSVVQTIFRRMIGWIMNDKLEMTWKEVVVANLGSNSAFSWKDWGKPRRPSDSTVFEPRFAPGTSRIRSRNTNHFGAKLEKLAFAQLVKKVPHLLSNLNVHYRVHKSPQLVPILSHTNSAHTVTLCFFNTHFIPQYTDQVVSLYLFCLMCWKFRVTCIAGGFISIKQQTNHK
jgi:hypothetical protein